MENNSSQLQSKLYDYDKNNLNIELNKIKLSLEKLIQAGGHHFDKAATDENGLTILLNGPLGCGKSFFINWFQSQLKDNTENKHYLSSHPKKEIIIINVNAFEMDGITDPFVAIVGAISEHYPDNHSDKYARAFRQSGKICYSAMKNLAPMLAPGIGNIIQAMLTIAEKTSSNNESKDDITKKYKNFIKERNDFKKSLSELGSTDSGDTPVKLIIIDDLDRCDLQFSYQMLETVKHFFETDNTVFLFAADKKVLCEVVRNRHGNRINGDDYLSRFFDYEINYPQTTEFSQKLLENIELPQEELLYRAMLSLLKYRCPPARQTKRFLQYLKLFQIECEANPEIILLLYQKTVSNSTFNITDEFKMEFQINPFSEKTEIEQAVDFVNESFIKMINIIFNTTTSIHSLRQLRHNQSDLFQILTRLFLAFTYDQKDIDCNSSNTIFERYIEFHDIMLTESAKPRISDNIFLFGRNLAATKKYCLTRIQLKKIINSIKYLS